MWFFLPPRDFSENVPEFFAFIRSPILSSKRIYIIPFGKSRSTLTYRRSKENRDIGDRIKANKSGTFSLILPFGKKKTITLVVEEK